MRKDPPPIRDTLASLPLLRCCWAELPLSHLFPSNKLLPLVEMLDQTGLVRTGLGEGAGEDPFGMEAFRRLSWLGLGQRRFLRTVVLFLRGQPST